MIGYEALYNCMLDNIEQGPQTLLDTLSKLGTDWIKGTQLDDDITLMIVRKNQFLTLLTDGKKFR